MVSAKATRTPRGLFRIATSRLKGAIVTHTAARFIFQSALHELLPPSLDGYGGSFVLHRGDTSTAPHLGQFLPGARIIGHVACHAGQSGFQPT